MHNLEYKSRPALVDWLTQNGQFDVYATVTLKQAVIRNDGFRQFISREECSKTSCVLRDRVSNKILGRARFKKGERLDWATFIHFGDGEKRFHLHLMIGKDTSITLAEFKTVFDGVCGQLDWVYEQRRFEEIRDIEGDGRKAVAFYCLKERTDAFDWQSSFFSNHRVG